jgi:hypothetical protein
MFYVTLLDDFKGEFSLFCVAEIWLDYFFIELVKKSIFKDKLGGCLNLSSGIKFRLCVLVVASKFF